MYYKRKKKLSEYKPRSSESRGRDSVFLVRSFSCQPPLPLETSLDTALGGLKKAYKYKDDSITVSKPKNRQRSLFDPDELKDNESYHRRIFDKGQYKRNPCATIFSLTWKIRSNDVDGFVQSLRDKDIPVLYAYDKITDNGRHSYHYQTDDKKTENMKSFADLAKIVENQRPHWIVKVDNLSKYPPYNIELSSPPGFEVYRRHNGTDCSIWDDIFEIKKIVENTPSLSSNQIDNEINLSIRPANWSHGYTQFAFLKLLSIFSPVFSMCSRGEINKDDVKYIHSVTEKIKENLEKSKNDASVKRNLSSPYGNIVPDFDDISSLLYNNPNMPAELVNFGGLQTRSLSSSPAIEFKLSAANSLAPMVVQKLTALPAVIVNRAGKFYNGKGEVNKWSRRRLNILRSLSGPEWLERIEKAFENGDTDSIIKIVRILASPRGKLRELISSSISEAVERVKF